MNRQFRFDAGYRMLGAGALGWMTQRDGMGREVGGGSGWGTRVRLWWLVVIYGKTNTIL